MFGVYSRFEAAGRAGQAVRGGRHSAAVSARFNYDEVGRGGDHVYARGGGRRVHAGGGRAHAGGGGRVGGRAGGGGHAHALRGRAHSQGGGSQSEVYAKLNIFKLI